jgi:hypothetical protein
MIVHHFNGSVAELLNPLSDTWVTATADTISLNPVPLDAALSGPPVIERER